MAAHGPMDKYYLGALELNNAAYLVRRMDEALLDVYRTDREELRRHRNHVLDQYIDASMTYGNMLKEDIQDPNDLAYLDKVVLNVALRAPRESMTPALDYRNAVLLRQRQ